MLDFYTVLVVSNVVQKAVRATGVTRGGNIYLSY